VHERSLAKSEHLRPVAVSRKKWIKQRPFALAACVLGIASFIFVSVMQVEFWSTPDWRYSVPGFGATALCALISLIRRERGPGFWALGLGIAGAALVLGWFMMLGIVIGAMFLLMVIISTVM
jgi:hypothetical protein